MDDRFDNLDMVEYVKVFFGSMAFSVSDALDSFPSLDDEGPIFSMGVRDVRY